MSMVHSPSAHTQPGSADSNALAHARGPWEIECGDHTHRYVHVTDTDDRTVHYKYACAGPREGERDEANARLIAAAPEMYAVLYEMFCEGPIDVAFAGNPVAIKALEDRIHAAIGKATTANSVGTEAEGRSAPIPPVKTGEG